MTAEEPRDTGLRLIVAYKLTKAVLELIAALVFTFASAQLLSEAEAIAAMVREHATSAWSVWLAERLIHAATARNVLIVTAASASDGALSFFEGWALYRRFRWSRWLVVGATSAFFPFEVVALVRRVTAGRVVLLLVNVAVVSYLVLRRTGRARGAHAT